MISVYVRRLRDVPMPIYHSAEAAGFDLTCAGEAPVYLMPGTTSLVPTGIAVEIPTGYELQVRPRSGLALRSCVFAMNGTVDSDYRGEVCVLLHNAGMVQYRVAPGDRIAQAIVSPIEHAVLIEAKELRPTARGTAGFGSTGR